MSFQFPTDYKFVLASLALVPAFSIYLGATVVKARKTAKVDLPLLFASEADAAADPAKHKFNCTQKSAMNFQEHMPGFVIGALISGVSFPRATAIGVLSWLSGRFLYHKGYSSGDPKKRSRGFHGNITHLAVTLAALYSAYTLVF
jgi:glutathione S-transferase